MVVGRRDVRRDSTTAPFDDDDLFLTRSLERATLVRTDPPGDVDVLAGIRQPLTAHVAEHPELRLTRLRSALAPHSTRTLRSAV